MKNKKILIFGKKSFIGNSLYQYLKVRHKVKIKNFNANELKTINNFDYIINCSINKDYVYKKYSRNNDIDFKIIKNIKNINTNFIFLSSRKIYKPKSNIKENSKIDCINNYEKNKLITENEILKFRSTKSIILRISNLIGYKKYNPNKVHFTYIDYLVDRVKRKEIIYNKNEFGDFLDVKTFSKIINMIIKKRVFGIYNVSLGRKVYLKEINKWLLFHLKNKNLLKSITLPQSDKIESFYLNNSKLKKSIKVKIDINYLKKECLKLSKKLFLKKN